MGRPALPPGERARRDRVAKKRYRENNREKIKVSGQSYRDKNRKKVRAAQRKWANENRDYIRTKSILDYKNATKRQRAKRKRWRSTYQKAKTWYKLNPEKKRAHSIIYLALRSGKLAKQPCEKCGELKVDAHHDDYSKPLKVRWLCRLHHREHHRKYK